MRWTGLRGLVLALLLGSAGAQAQDVVSDFAAGPPSGRYSFNSWTPKGLPDLLKGNTAGERTPVVGHLFLPPGADKVPAIIFMHGSGGVYEAMLDYWPRQFNGAGYAMLAMDSFGPRGVKSTAEDQSQVPFAADTADVFAALKLLATHPRIDAQRIAILGTSRGGITSWRSALERVIEAQGLSKDLRFAAHVQLYAGGCVGTFRVTPKPGVFSPAPQLWLHGDVDDYTPMAPCQEYAALIAKTGTPVSFVVIPGAGHKFDGEPQRRVMLKNAQMTLASCPLELDMQTLRYQDRFTSQPLNGEAVREVAKASCSALGASVEGNHAARDQAAKAVLAFLHHTFGR